MNKIKSLAISAWIIILAVTLIAPTAGAQVICNKFKLLTKVKGSTIDLSVDTDLPDNTVVMVSVSRSYLEKGNTDAYSVEYFSEKSTLRKWKSKHRISVDSGKWKSALREKQEKMSRLGLGFDVASISEKITACIVAPINQPDPRFGKQNSKLTGKAVRATGLRVVEDEIEIDYPLNLPPVGKSPFPSLNPLELEVGQAYIVTKQTPLMPSHSPADPFAALQKMKQIPEGGGFKVHDMFDKKGSPWYSVSAFDQRKKQIGRGWINSTALLGKTLRHTRAGNPELKKLYYDLLNFKDDAEFHRVGFGVCCKYKKWQLKVEALRNNEALTIIDKIAVGDLLMLGLEYMKTKGKENDYTKFARESIAESLE